MKNKKIRNPILDNRISKYINLQQMVYRGGNYINIRNVAKSSFRMSHYATESYRSVSFKISLKKAI